jgi:nucleoside-diphosphate-sugar epimerase
MLTKITVTGGGGAMGLVLAGSILESGGDVICLDLADEPPKEEWGKHNRRCPQILALCPPLSLSQSITPFILTSHT